MRFKLEGLGLRDFVSTPEVPFSTFHCGVSSLKLNIRKTGTRIRQGYWGTYLVLGHVD